MNKKTIFLASASPRRRELLALAGIKFQILPADIEETTQSRIPARMVRELSRQKALAVFEGFSEEEKEHALVIGADTLVAVGERVLGKPADEQDAEEMLALLQGNTHQVYTGVTLIFQEWNNQKRAVRKVRTFVEKTSVTMYPVSSKEIRDYVATGEPMDKAGAYGIQGRCAAWIKRISGDYSNVVGLPVGRLWQELKKMDLEG
ncbi:MAG: Maf family protein [Lachnospiraceae bacterium]|nr:Maf family protein [Lachnospiraceae bacterium]